MALTPAREAELIAHSIPAVAIAAYVHSITFAQLVTAVRARMTNMRRSDGLSISPRISSRKIAVFAIDMIVNLRRDRRWRNMIEQSGLNDEGNPKQTYTMAQIRAAVIGYIAAHLIDAPSLAHHTDAMSDAEAASWARDALGNAAEASVNE